MYLAGRGLSARAVGTVVAAGLAGTALAAGLATFFGDRRGRRRLLLDVALLGVAGAVLLAFSGSLAALSAAAFIGMINGMGRDRGASMIVEQAAIPAVAGDGGRTRALALYNVAQDAGHAVGALLAGLPSLLAARADLTPVSAHRAGLGLYAVLLLATAVLYVRLSPRVEEGRSGGVLRVSEASLGPVPLNVSVRPYVPQLEVLQRASVFVTHGGMNSVSESLFNGVPLTVIPHMSEQEIVGRRVEQLGAGIFVAKESAAPDVLRSSVERLLKDDSFAARARDIGQSFRDAGGVQRAADAIRAFSRME